MLNLTVFKKTLLVSLSTCTMYIVHCTCYCVFDSEERISAKNSGGFGEAKRTVAPGISQVKTLKSTKMHI